MEDQNNEENERAEETLDELNRLFPGEEEKNKAIIDTIKEGLAADDHAEDSGPEFADLYKFRIETERMKRVIKVHDYRTMVQGDFNAGVNVVALFVADKVSGKILEKQDAIDVLDKLTLGEFEEINEQFTEAVQVAVGTEKK